MCRRILYLAFLLSALVCRGEEGLLESPDQSVYAKDGLYLKVALVDNAKEFLTAWADPLRRQPPMLKTRTTFHRGDVIFPALMFSTNALGPEGDADITYTVLFRRPDGSIYEHLKDLTVVKGPPAQGIGLCKAKAGLKIEKTDPFGEYTIKVTTTDHIKDVTVEMIFYFQVVDPEAKPPPTPAAEIPSREPVSIPTPTPYPTSRVRSFSDDLR